MSTSTTRDLSSRLRQRLDELARVGAHVGGGITRLAYTQAEREAHAVFAGQAEAEGWRCTVDPAGNTLAACDEAKRYVLLGSHLDTTRHGGAYDGAAGVAAALEMARQLSGDSDLGVRVVAFAGEEGARFGRPTLGSSAAAGLLSAADVDGLRDSEGVSLREAAAVLGLAPEATRPWLAKDNVALFVEIHIEQGRQLELSVSRIGIVDTIAGSTRLRIDVIGHADHSGATPMHIRADALAAASEIVLAAERIGRAYRSTTVTVGRLDVQPNSVTTVPGRVSLWIDVRDVDAGHQRLAAFKVLEEARELVRARSLELSTCVISHQRPTVLDAWPRVLAREICIENRISHRVLSSGAGHDSAVVAQRAPTALLFIPCADGVSHAPTERARVEDLALAVEVGVALVRRAQALFA